MITAADYLTDYVNQCAGEALAAQWFRRNIDGSGLGLAGIDLSDSYRGRRFPLEHFPELFIQTDTHDLEHSQLIEEFLCWKAPWLLLLKNIDDETRQHYEQLARQHALVVAQQFRLYPQIIEENQIKAARIEAKLRRSQPTEEDNTPMPSYLSGYGRLSNQLTIRSRPNANQARNINL